METKKLSNLVIDFFRNDIVWLVFYLAFAATVVERSITWLFFSDFAGGMTLRVVLGLWSTVKSESCWIFSPGPHPLKAVF
jgi:hypothetical protein